MTASNDNVPDEQRFAGRRQQLAARAWKAHKSAVSRHCKVLQSALFIVNNLHQPILNINEKEEEIEAEQA